MNNAQELAKHIYDMFVSNYGTNNPTTKDMKVVCDALAQPEQSEPVGYFYFDDGQWKQAHDPISFPACAKLYTQPKAPEPLTYTSGHCKEKAKPGGCQLHNLQCGYPECDRKSVLAAQRSKE